MILELRPFPWQPSDQYVIQQPQPVSPVTPLLGIGLTIGALWLLDQLLNPPRPARRALRQADKDYVSQRDGWRCTYCDRRLNRRTRHIDHSVSVANGGTDHINNLRLACAPCNLCKGALNARDFRRIFY
jgi:hypothetical protein